MEIISPSWFIWHALFGVAVGYILRVVEHAMWISLQGGRTESTFGFATRIIPQCFVIGATLTYISVVLLVPVIKDEAAISFSVYLLSAFWAFISLDIRSFFRRH